MALRFRNLEVSPDDPVELWGVEGILTAIERGGVDDWRKVVRTAVADPSGEVAADLAQALEIAEAPGSVAAVRAMLTFATLPAREATVLRLRQAYLSTEYSQAEAARRLDTSASRLSTYLSGKVMPSAEFLVRIEALAAKRIDEVRAI